MDDVLAETLPAICDAYNKIYKTSITQEDIDNWKFYKSLGHDDAEGQKIINEIFSIENFWLNIEPKHDAFHIMADLNKTYELYVASAPFPTKKCIPDKITWMKKHFPFLSYHQIIFIYNKGLLRGDIMIDDKPDNLIVFHGLKVLYRTPVNRQYNDFDHIVNNWREIKNLFLK